MSRDEQLKQRWIEVEQKLSRQFADGEKLELDAIIYIIGLQELGQLHRKFKKDHKLDLMHIAICRLLEPYGYYEFEYFDDESSIDKMQNKYFPHCLGVYFWRSSIRNIVF